MVLLFLYSVNHLGKKVPVHRVVGFSGVNTGSGKRILQSLRRARGIKRLTELVGTGLFQAGREVVRKNAEIQYREATPTPKASEQEHLEEFDQAWLGWERKWFAGLSAAERQKYEALTTQHERDGFRIVRNWSQTRERRRVQNSMPEFG